MAFPDGCCGRKKFREGAHFLPRETQNPLVWEAWEEGRVGPLAWSLEQGEAPGATELEACLLTGELMTWAGSTGQELHKHEACRVRVGRAGRQGKDVSCLNLKPGGKRTSEETFLCLYKQMRAHIHLYCTN